MDPLRAAPSSWLDPQVLGELALAWSGRVLGALHGLSIPYPQRDVHIVSRPAGVQ